MVSSLKGGLLEVSFPHETSREAWDGSTSLAALKEIIRGKFEKKITGFFHGHFSLQNCKCTFNFNPTFFLSIFQC